MMSKDSVSSRARNASASARPSRDRASYSTAGPNSGTYDSSGHGLAASSQSDRRCDDSRSGLPDASTAVRARAGELPAGQLGAHQPPEPEDFGVPRVEYRLYDVLRCVHRGLEFTGDAIAQEN